MKKIKEVMSSEDTGKQGMHAADLMPTSKEAKRILQERSEQFASLETNNEKHIEEIHYVQFKLGSKESYGIPYQYVKEVMQNIAITKLPCAPDFIPGIINRRGVLLAVLNLKKFFHLKDIKMPSSNYVIIITGDSITVAILADTIEGSDAYEPANLEIPMASINAIDPKFILGIHRGMTAIINIDAIVKDSQFLQMMQEKMT